MDSLKDDGRQPHLLNEMAAVCPALQAHEGRVVARGARRVAKYAEKAIIIILRWSLRIQTNGTTVRADGQVNRLILEFDQTATCGRALKWDKSMVRIQRTLVSLIIRSGAGVLLLQRGQPYSEFLRHDPDTQVGIDLWELPGGGLDFEETPLQAAVRETLEETGISIKEGNLKLVACCAYTLKGSECESHRAHIIYEVVVGAPLDAKRSKEHATYQWVQDKDALQGLPMIVEVRDLIAARF